MLRLRAKVPLLILAILFSAGIPAAAFGLYELNQSHMQQLDSTASMLVEVIQADLEYHMAERAPRRIQRVMGRVGELPNAKDVAVFGPAGEIIASSRENEIGSISRDPQVHAALRSGERAATTRRDDEGTTFSAVFPVANRSECTSCHGTEQGVLGAIQLSLDAGVLDEQLVRQGLAIAASGGLSILLIGWLLNLALGRVVLGPLARLDQSAERFSQGDYAARVRVAGNDEVGRFARSFNRMAQQVESHTRELAGWNAQLEEKVAARARELSALNAVVAATSRSLDLAEVVASALNEIVAATKADAAAVQLLRASAESPVVLQRGLPTEVGADPELLVERIELPWEAKAPSLNTAPLGQAGQETGAPVVAANSEGQTTMDDGPPSAGFRSYLKAPIGSESEALGSLYLFSATAGYFGPDDERLVEAMADAMAAGIRNAHIASQLRDTNCQIGVLLQQATEGGFGTRFDNPHLVKCWEEKNCCRQDCLAYGSNNLRCWQIAGTLCPEGTDGQYARKLDSCRQCVVFQKSCWRDEITSIGESFNDMIFLLDFEATQRAEITGQLVERLISAQEDERKRVARELHDQTGQSLTSLLVGLKNLEVAGDLEQVRIWAAGLEAQVVQMLDEVHRLALELRPAELDEIGLVAAVRRYLKESSERSSIAISFRASGLQDRLNPAVETALYRIVQEGITNVVKHAGARNISVSLEAQDSALVAQIQDDGNGFDVRAAPVAPSVGKRLGLVGMRERATLLGGTFALTSAAGRGTTVTVKIPISSGARSN